MSEESVDMLSLTAEIVTAHLSHNKVATTDLSDLIQAVHGALAALGQPAAPEPAKAEPAVPVRLSIKHDYLVCLEDGAKLKMLKRYLRTNYDMTPEDYRAKWGLPRHYPMVAPAYAETRKQLAVKSGLGRKPADQGAEINANPSASIDDAPGNARKRVSKSKLSLKI